MVSGGVAAPGASCLGGEFRSGDLVVSESVGDDGRGHFQDMLTDRAGSPGGGRDAEVIDQRWLAPGRSIPQSHETRPDTFKNHR